MQRTFLAGSLSALLFGMSFPATALDAPSWDYASLAWVVSGDYEEDPASIDLNGYRLNIVKSLGNMAFVRAMTNAYDISSGGVDIDLSTQQVGVGARYPVGGAVPLDIWGSVNYERIGFTGIVGTGFGIDLGVRSQVTSKLDLGLTLKVFGDIDFGVFDADYTGYELNATYAVQPDLAALLSLSNYELDEGSGKGEFKNVIALGIRFNY